MNLFSKLTLSPVAPVVVTVHASSLIFHSSAIGLGVVVTSARGRPPRLKPICRLVHVSSGLPHFASSSAHAKSCSGPRSPSGLSPENSCASLPFGHLSRPRLGSHSTLLRLRLATAMM